MRKVIYWSYQEYFLELSSKMESFNWTPVYCVTKGDIENKIKEKYPDVICHNTYDAIKGIPPSEYRDRSFLPLCPSLLEKMSLYERVSLKMILDIWIG